MTSLVSAVVQELASRPSLTTLLGHDSNWPTWIFEYKNQVVIENTQKCMIVVNTSGAWQPANSHNTMKFPRLVVDVWADPTRNPDKSMKFDDAEDKIEAVGDELIKILHITGHQTHYFSDVRINGSTWLDGWYDIRPMKDNPGGKMGTFYFGVSL